MTQRSGHLEGDVAKFVRQYARKRYPGMDPNDRHYDRELEKLIKRMKPEELDELMRGVRDGEGANDRGPNLDGQRSELPLRCPCCFCKTLSERSEFEVCAVCFWEDDGQDAHDADVVRGGPNGPLSLDQARANYREFGACDVRSLAYVRRPRPEEVPSGDAT